MTDDNYRIVRYDKYCHKCKHKQLNENRDPCEECLSTPLNMYSEKPVKFESRK